ncbi:hypothetical protein [Herbaspirillum huttiense]|uniref:hypothetical protein n=1 Tax=Herbaspirillum huttiense TaxID=863372 RepID=UPI0031E37ADD
MATPAIATPSKPLSEQGVWTLSQVASLVTATRRRFLNAEGFVQGCNVPLDHAVFAELMAAMDKVQDEIQRATLAHIDAVDGRH